MLLVELVLFRKLLPHRQHIATERGAQRRKHARGQEAEGIMAVHQLSIYFVTVLNMPARRNYVSFHSLWAQACLRLTAWRLALVLPQVRVDTDVT